MNTQTQKGFGLPIILAAVAIILVIGALLFTSRKSAEEESSSRELPRAGETAPEMEEMMAPMTAILTAQNDSGQVGTATLSAIGEQTRVVLNLTGAPLDTPQPAHIHLASCENLGGVDHPLTAAVNGYSETILDIPLTHIHEDLPLAINVHKSVSEVGVYVACGNIVP